MARFVLSLIVTSALRSVFSVGAVKPFPLATIKSLWSAKVMDSEVGEGNMLQIANDGYIYITSKNCEIKRINRNGAVVDSVLGDVKKLCRSALGFSQDYSYFLQASQLLNETDSSLITAYSTASLTPRWSKKIIGLTEGDPIVSTDGAYTYIVSNSLNNTKAYLVALENTNGEVVFVEASTIPSGSRSVAYASLGIGRNPVRGNWASGGKNTNDMLVWGELYIPSRGVGLSDGSTAFDGAIHFFQLPSNFYPPDNRTDIFTDVSPNLQKVTLSAPAIQSHGEGAFFTFHAGQIRGWTKGQWFGRVPTIKFAVDKQFDNTVPEPWGGIFAKNNSVYIFPGPEGREALYAYGIVENATSPIDSSARPLWTLTATKLIQAKAQLAFDESLLYYIESKGGDVVCVDTMTGSIKWRRPTVGGSVLADFVIYEDKYLMYATTSGFVTLLQIGADPTSLPTVRPSNKPTTRKPSSFPTVHPTAKPSSLPTLNPTGQPTRHPSRKPSSAPTAKPTIYPTTSGTEYPTVGPTVQPSPLRTALPIKSSLHPTNMPPTRSDTPPNLPETVTEPVPINRTSGAGGFLCTALATSLSLVVAWIVL